MIKYNKNNSVYKLLNFVIITDFKRNKRNQKLFEEILNFIEININLKEKINSLNKITITFSDKKEIFLESFEEILFSIKGKCNLNTNEIIIDFRKKDMIITLFHEIGHLYYNSLSIENKFNFISIYENEKKYQEYIIDDIDEFFAESFAIYILDSSKKLLIPNTIEFIKKDNHV